MLSLLMVELLKIRFLAKLAVCSLPIIAIQHAVSWRFQNLVLPLAVGMMTTVGITQIGSSSHWMWYPWVYALMAVNGAAAAQQQALMLAAAVGTALFAASAWALGRREVEQ